MTKLMIFDGFWVLSNTDRTWFSMFFIKNRSFRVFQENYTLLPFDRSPKSSETSHFRCCEICYWQQDLSDDPKRRIHQKISGNYPIFGFRLSMGTDFGIQNSENLAVVRVRFVENCFSTFEMCCRLYRVQNNHITITQNHNQVWSHLQSVMNVRVFSHGHFFRSSELNLYFVTRCGISSYSCKEQWGLSPIVLAQA